MSILLLLYGIQTPTAAIVPVVVASAPANVITYGGAGEKLARRKRIPRVVVPDVIRSANYNNLITYEDEEIVLLL